MEFHDDFPQYEFRDQHDDVVGKKQRRRLWNVFWIMLGITIFELILGSYAANTGKVGPTTLKIVFISLTILKAYFIVYEFMHLGHEAKSMKWIIIGPYTGFIMYLVFMCTIAEGNYSKTHRVSHPDKAVVHGEGAAHEEAAPAGEEEHK
jgi:cytochrome c oxidase subunit 4